MQYTVYHTGVPDIGAIKNDGICVGYSDGLWYVMHIDDCHIYYVEDVSHMYELWPGYARTNIHYNDGKMLKMRSVPGNINVNLCSGKCCSRLAKNLYIGERDWHRYTLAGFVTCWVMDGIVIKYHS